MREKSLKTLTISDLSCKKSDESVSVLSKQTLTLNHDVSIESIGILNPRVSKNATKSSNMKSSTKNDPKQSLHEDNTFQQIVIQQDNEETKLDTKTLDTILNATVYGTQYRKPYVSFYKKRMPFKLLQTLQFKP